MGIERPAILIVDDNSDNLVALRALILEVFPDAKIREAQDGLKCIDLARLSKPDAILLDVVMPGMDGFSVCKTLKSDAGTRDIPVIFVTALKSEAEIRIRALDAGAEGFISKPLDQSELTAQIRAMLKIRELNRFRSRQAAELAALVEERTRDLEQEIVERLRSQRQLRFAEDRYRAIFEHMAAGCCIDEIVYKDGEAVDYRILDVNPSFEKITGISSAKAIGSMASDVYGISPPPLLDFFREVAETGKAAALEAYFESVGKDLQMTVSCPGKGLFSTVFTDATERKRIETKLYESERGLRRAQEVAHVGSWIWHIASNTLEWSDEMYRIFGIEKEKFTGRLPDVVAAAIHPDDRAAVEASNRSVEQEGRPIPLEYRIVMRDGSIRTVWAEAGELIRDERGRPVTLTGIVQDITDRKEAENRMHSLNQDLERRVHDRTAQLEAANKELEAFAYSVSHDLRAPLRAMDGFSEALLAACASRLDPESLHYLDRIKEAARKMGILVEELLNLSQITRIELIRENVDITFMARSIAQELASSAPERRVEFVIAPDMAADADPNLLKIVMNNLMGNAWKFSSAKHDARIEIGCDSSSGEPVFFVRDNGAGFDMAYVDKLFTAFQRLHGAKEFPGTGIGLATVHRIIGKHGGRIWTQASPGAGAIFYFTLK